MCNTYHSYACFCYRVAYSRKGQRILRYVYISQLWLCSTAMPKRPTEATHTLSFTVIRTSNKITEDSAMISRGFIFPFQLLKTVKTQVIQTQMDMCEIENKSFKENKRLFLVHISPWEVMKTPWIAVRKLFYFHNVMYFWLKQDLVYFWFIHSFNWIVKG